MSMYTILIAGDICPIGNNEPLFRAGDAIGLFNDLLREMKAADLRIANLECPLIDRESPIPKTGPSFGAAPECIRGIKAAGMDVLCLANNHIMDHGPAGLTNTMEVCRAERILTIGAGGNLVEARKIVIAKVGAVRVGLLAMAEHEFSIAGKDSPGANPLDLIDFVRNVRDQRSEFDYLIVLVHGSDEFFVPTPRIKKTCHFMVEMGANAVIVQHPHVLGGYEDYRGGHIVYGQGAFVMDEEIYRGSPSFHEGFLVKLLVDDSARSQMQIVPFEQSNPGPGARRLSGEREHELLARLEARSRLIQNDEFVEAEWLKYCRENKYGYLNTLLGFGRVTRRLNRRGWLTRLLYTRRALLGVRNCVCCETHREALQTILDKLV